MIFYKIDVEQALINAGYTSGRIQREKVFSGQTWQNIREKKPVNMDTLNRICCILRKQPGDIIKCIPSDEEKLKYF